jgi:uncharacterized protein (DUF885 family)
MRNSVLAIVLLVLFSGCDSPSSSNANVGNASYTEVEINAETEKLYAWFEDKYEQRLMLSPIALTFQGRPERKGEVDDFSETFADKRIATTKANLNALIANFDYNKLTPDAKVSYDVWKYQAERAIEADAFRSNSYVFEQMNAIHSFFPQLLIAFHSVTTKQDMLDYISRINGTAVALDQLIAYSKSISENGVRPPYFAFEAVIEESQSIISGMPFDEGDDSAVWADAKQKIAALLEAGTIEPSEADAMRLQAEQAFIKQFKPAYERLIAWQVEDQKNVSPTANGVSELPNGISYYNERLANNTTTALTADEIHNIGLQEVARLRTEMERVKTEFGFKGSLDEFFVFLRDTKDDRRLYYPNTDEGRQGYIDDATTAIDNIKSQLPNYFGILPKADMVVKRVEAFREQDGAAQHYFPPALDGSRPGVYYAHLSDMTAMPKRELEVIAYHEGLPGHHMQIAIAQELKNVPTFRTQAGFTAYSEGWALYSEWLAKQMPGTFQDALSEFGRLGSEMWRAVRLVVDTGLHAKGWSEQKAIDYFKQNSAITETQAKSEVRRYLVLPGQATSYKIGMLKIQALRAKAEKELGEKFDIKGFHDVVLGGGAVPLSILEFQVENWISSKQ